MKYIALVLMVVGMGFAMAADYTPASYESAVSFSSASISMTNLPTATTGLASGRIWANSNVLTVIP